MVIGLRVGALLLVLTGFASLILGKTSGVAIAADEPFRWDGETNIMVVYHADYEAREETCAIEPDDPRGGPSRTFAYPTHHRDLGGIMGIRGIDSINPVKYDGAAAITCQKDGNKVLTGFQAVVAKFWLYWLFAAVIMLVAAWVLKARRGY